MGWRNVRSAPAASAGSRVRLSLSTRSTRRTLTRFGALGGSAFDQHGLGASLIALPQIMLYCASKHAVVGLFQSLAADLHGSGIAMTIFYPCAINTAVVMNTAMRASARASRNGTVTFCNRNAASTDKVVADVLHDVRRDRLFCVTSRAEVGLGWLAQRLSSALAQALTRVQT